MEATIRAHHSASTQSEGNRDKYGTGSIMAGSWALPAGTGRPSATQAAPARERALDTSAGLYPDDTQRGLDPTSPTGTKGAYDPYTGAFGTAGTPVTCGYGKSGSTIGVGYTGGRRRWEERGRRGSTPDAYAYEHGGNPAPRRSQPNRTPAPAPATSPAPASGFGWLDRLLGGLGATA
jgi:hypothetical protein